MKTSAVFGLALLTFATLAHAAPILPNINTNNIITVTNAPYNAKGDGSTDNTLAISNAIVAAAKGGTTNGLIGGTVRIPASGTYLSGPLTLKNNVNIQIDTNATLAMLPINLFTNYPSNVSGEVYGSLVYASGLTNLEISGSGTIDGQGLPWWSAPNSIFTNRPYMIYFNSSCQRVLIENVTIQNAPAQLVVFKGNKTGNITVHNMTEIAPPSSGVDFPSHNTDGLDLVGTNILVQSCTISVGDDNIALGSSSGATANILVTNCAFGTGHGVSIGSYTSGGVSNMTVINCTFSGTDNGIRMKSDNSRGGVTQNLNYFNIGMTNILYYPILIYSYYSSFGTPTWLTPQIASTQAVAAVSSTTPIWRNVIISNLTATVSTTNGGIAGILWGRTELPITNVVLSKINITAPSTFEVCNAYGITFIDSQFTIPSTNATLAIYNAGLTITNSTAGASSITLDGLTSTNSLALYNVPASTGSTNVFGAKPITLSGSVLVNTNDLTLPGSSVVNFALGTNDTKVAVTGNLMLNSTLNITNAGGFTATNYTLFTYTGSLGGSPILGSTPTGFTNYTYSLNTNTAGKILFVVSLPAPPSPPEFENITTASGTNIVISGTGGTTNGTYYVLTSTNVTLPLTNWARLATNLFDTNGHFAFTNAIGTNSPRLFYLLQLP